MARQFQKPVRTRILYTEYQKDYMEWRFRASANIIESTRKEVAEFLNISEKRVANWFYSYRRKNPLVANSQNRHSMPTGHNHFYDDQINSGVLENTGKDFNPYYKIVKDFLETGKRKYDAISPVEEYVENAKRKRYNCPIRSAEGSNQVLEPIDNRQNRCEPDRYNKLADDELGILKVEFYNIENKLETDANANYYNYPKLPVLSNSFVYSQTDQMLPDKVQVKIQNTSEWTADDISDISEEYPIAQVTAQDWEKISYTVETRDFFIPEKIFGSIADSSEGFKRFVQIPNEDDLAMPLPRYNIQNNSIPTLWYNEKYHSQIDNESTNSNTNDYFRNTFNPKHGEIFTRNNEENNPNDYFESLQFAIDLSLNQD